MHVSPNIIRFPVPPPVAAHASVAARPTPQPAEIVPFAASDEQASYRATSPEHGQFFAAHRIVSRVADQLDAIATL